MDMFVWRIERGKKRAREGESKRICWRQRGWDMRMTKSPAKYERCVFYGLLLLSLVELMIICMNFYFYLFYFVLFHFTVISLFSVSVSVSHMVSSSVRLVGRLLMLLLLPFDLLMRCKSKCAFFCSLSFAIRNTKHHMPTMSFVLYAS